MSPATTTRAMLFSPRVHRVVCAQLLFVGVSPGGPGGVIVSTTMIALHPQFSLISPIDDQKEYRGP